MRPTPTLIACAVCLAVFVFAALTRNPMTAEAVGALAVAFVAYAAECAWRRMETGWRLQDMKVLGDNVDAGARRTSALESELKGVLERVTILENRTQVRVGR